MTDLKPDPKQVQNPVLLIRHVESRMLNQEGCDGHCTNFFFLAKLVI